MILFLQIYYQIFFFVFSFLKRSFISVPFLFACSVRILKLTSNLYNSIFTSAELLFHGLMQELQYMGLQQPLIIYMYFFFFFFCRILEIIKVGLTLILLTCRYVALYLSIIYKTVFVQTCEGSQFLYKIVFVQTVRSAKPTTFFLFLCQKYTQYLQLIPYK